MKWKYQPVGSFWTPNVATLCSSLRLCGRCWKDASGGVPDGDAESCAKNTFVLVLFQVVQYWCKSTISCQEFIMKTQHWLIICLGDQMAQLSSSNMFVLIRRDFQSWLSHTFTIFFQPVVQLNLATLFSLRKTPLRFRWNFRDQSDLFLQKQPICECFIKEPSFGTVPYTQTAPLKLVCPF